MLRFDGYFSSWVNLKLMHFMTLLCDITHLFALQLCYPALRDPAQRDRELKAKSS